MPFLLIALGVVAAVALAGGSAQAAQPAPGGGGPQLPGTVATLRAGHAYTFILRATGVIDPVLTRTVLVAMFSTFGAANLVLGNDADAGGPDPTIWRGSFLWLGTDGMPVGNFQDLTWLQLVDMGPAIAPTTSGVVVGYPGKGGPSYGLRWGWPEPPWFPGPYQAGQLGLPGVWQAVTPFQGQLVGAPAGRPCCSKCARQGGGH